MSTPWPFDYEEGASNSRGQVREYVMIGGLDNIDINAHLINLYECTLGPGGPVHMHDQLWATNCGL